MKSKANGPDLVGKEPQEPDPNLRDLSHYSGSYLAETIGLSNQIAIWNAVASRKEKQQD